MPILFRSALRLRPLGLRPPGLTAVSLASLVLALALALLAPPAAAATLTVGPGQPYPSLSAAIPHARPGDVVRIAPGQYADCAVIGQSNLTIEAAGPGVVFAGKSCAGKGILVIAGDDVVVRGLTLQGARVPDHNGAGIRAEGGNLTVEGVQFLGNENGMLINPNPAATIRVRDSRFIANGSCEGGCAHGIYAAAVHLLQVEHSAFRATRAGHHIKSRADITEVVDCVIEDGPDGTASYLIEAPNGGDLLIERNRMEKGPHSQNASAAIVIGAEGVTRPTRSITVRDNRFVNDLGRPTTFVRNQTSVPASLSGNQVTGPVQALAGPGTVR
jgi:hypothetical protein